MENKLPLGVKRGFTLLELLVIIAILGILAAVAISQLTIHQRRGYDTDVKANVKNAATFEDAYFIDKNTYTDSLAVLKARGFAQSAKVSITLSATATQYTVTGTSKVGCSANTGVWTFDNTKGVLTGTACD